MFFIKKEVEQKKENEQWLKKKEKSLQIPESNSGALDWNAALTKETRKRSCFKRGMLLKVGTGNGQRETGNREPGRESGNECTAVIPMRIQNGERNEVALI